MSDEAPQEQPQPTNAPSTHSQPPNPPQNEQINLRTMKPGDQIPLPDGGHYTVFDHPKQMEESTQKAIFNQTYGQKIPGYSGFIPGRMSLSLFGGTYGDVANRYFRFGDFCLRCVC